MAVKRPAIVTTSWDDGHPLDLRLADLLACHGLRGTFYVPLQYAGFPRMAASQMRTLQSIGMEIGSHTVAHSRLPRLPAPKALRELTDSRDGLEQMLGCRVRSFCFPEGKFSQRDLPLLRQAGYELARTTVAFRTDLDFHPYNMPVTFQFWPHCRQILIRHALKEGNLSGLWQWLTRWHGEFNIHEFTSSVMDYIDEYGGILHIWGHSWEVDQAGLWPLLDRTLAVCAHRPGIEYLTNIEALDRTVAAEAVPAVMYA